MSQQPVRPLHTHYTLHACGTVYPAMANPPGYEDANPKDWRPSTPDEIAAYRANAARSTASQQYLPDGGTKLSGNGAVGLGGGVIRMADDDVPPPPGAVQPVMPEIPAAPASEIPAAPVAPVAIDLGPAGG